MNYNEFKKNFSGEEVSFENDKEFIYAHIYSLFQDTIVNEFSKRNLTSSEKQFYTKLILEEIDAFKKRISNEIPIIFNENYDDWEMMHYEDALEWCNDTLAEFDFDNKYLVYVSSW